MSRFNLVPRLWPVAGKKQPVAAARCPNCNCILDRPHALRCTRCLALIPGSSGCKNCGRCQHPESVTAS